VSSFRAAVGQDLEGRPAHAAGLLRRGAALPFAGVRAVFVA
jgi:hypothetical protein